MKKLNDRDLIETFEALVISEKKITAEVIEHLREMGARKLYLQLGHTSMFAYLTKGLGYAPASAQRRIEAARLMEVAPDLKENIETGEINLTQISIFSRGLRQKGDVSDEVKADLLDKIKGESVTDTEVIVARELDLTLREAEKARSQKDESVRLEITITKEEMEVFQRLKEVISHTHPSPTWAELFLYATKVTLEKKDPLTPRNFRTEAAEGQSKSQNKNQSQKQSKAQTKHEAHTRDRSCQWIDPASGKKCGSKHQLQMDHIQPKWAGGPDGLENIQRLCSVHNKLKYEKYG